MNIVAVRLDRVTIPGTDRDSVAHLMGIDLDTVRQLTTAQRVCIALRVVVGLSVSDTADALGKSEAGVKALEYRATQGIRQLVEAAGHGVS